LQTLVEGPNVFAYQMRCARPGRAETGGGDWITFNGRRGAVRGFTIGGSITGLTMAGLQLQSAHRDTIDISPGASSFAFPMPMTAGLPYTVRLRRQPVGGICTIANASGTVAATDVTNVDVSCRPTQSTTIGYAVVANENSASASLFSRSSSNGITLVDTKTSGSTPEAVVISPNGLFAYVANLAQGSIASFSIDYATNKLVPIPLGSPTTAAPIALAMDPDGTVLLAANNNTNTGSGALSLFSINAATGAPTPVTTVATGRLPAGVAIDPTGSFAYTVNEGSSDISIFRLNRTTPSLTSIGTVPNAVLSGKAIVAAPTGNLLFALGNSGTIMRLSINPTTGALTTLGFTSVNGASSCMSMAAQPGGGILYVACASASGSKITAYAIGGDGSLTLGPVTTLATTGPASIAVGGGGLAMHVAMKAINQVALYSINASTGELTLRTSVASPGGPVAIAATH
jgi:6-phosphogluconolactonase (cycloisomerase 2 family)